MQAGAENHAPGQPGDAHAGHQQPKSKDPAEAVQCRGKGGEQEALMCVQHAHEQAADAEDRRGNQQDAHQVGGGGDLIRIGEAWGDDMHHEPASADRRQQTGKHQNHRHEIAYGGRQFPGARDVAAGKEPGERWDKGRGQRSAGHQQEDELRQTIGGVKGIQVGLSAEGL